MKIWKILPIISVLLSIFFLIPVPAMASDNIQIYLDDQKLTNIDDPRIINGRTLLPMRTLFELFSLDLKWDPEDKTVEAKIGQRKIKIQINNKQVFSQHSSSNEWYEEKPIDQPPIIINGRTYVPLRFLAEELNCRVDWDSKSQKISIRRPFIYKDGSWYITKEGFWRRDNISEGYAIIKPDGYRVWEAGEYIFASVLVGLDPTMSSGYLYALDNKGNSRLIANTSDRIINIKVDDGSCYVLASNWGWYVTNSITKIPLDDPFAQFALGENGFSYGRFIKATENDYSLNLERIRDDNDFQIREDGIYTIGYNAALAPEGMMLTRDIKESFPLLEKSYGYYLLSKDGNSHKLMQNEKLER